jgi:hypothetical protein
MHLAVALLVMLLMSALGAALALTTTSQPLIAANFRAGHEALHAADAAAERAIGDLALVADWNQVLNGTLQSTFVDGLPTGARTLPNGVTVDLTQVASHANCHKPGPCSSAEMDAATPERPWGPNNPRWQLYAYGPLADVVPGARIDSPFYVVALVGDDASETDGNPLRDGAPGEAGAGMVALRAEAFGPHRAHQVVELTVSRSAGAIRVVSFREMR